jgi:hypothetical protein
VLYLLNEFISRMKIWWLLDTIKAVKGKFYKKGAKMKENEIISECKQFPVLFLCLLLTVSNAGCADTFSAPMKNTDGNGKAIYKAIEIFPLVRQHVHGSTIVELPNGDLLAAWFQGSGERQADDVAIMSKSGASRS